MENKYYTPDLTEFCLGFEYDFLQNHGSPEQEWVSLTLDCISDGEDDARLGLTLKALENYDNVYIRNAWRVKYLDQSDIESFGFEYFSITKGYYKSYYLQVKDKTYWIMDREDGLLDIHCPYKDVADTRIFVGTVKNKSQLRQLLKMLNIIE